MRVVFILCSAGAGGFKFTFYGKHLEDIYEYNEKESQAF